MNGFLVDTNVVSELRKRARMDAGVAQWIASRGRHELFLSSITLAELRRGAALLDKRDQEQAKILQVWIGRVQREFGRTGRLLSIRAAEAQAWGELQAIRPLPIMDCFLAATAKVHNLTLVTRNEIDFAGLPITTLNPFLPVGTSG